jgi:hypothetical protein
MILLSDSRFLKSFAFLDRVGLRGIRSLKLAFRVPVLCAFFKKVRWTAQIHHREAGVDPFVR